MRTLLAILLLSTTAHATTFTFKVDAMDPASCDDRRLCNDFDYHWEYDQETRELSLLDWSKGGKYGFEPDSWTLEQVPDANSRGELHHPTWDQGVIELTDQLSGITDSVYILAIPWEKAHLSDPRKPAYSLSLNRYGPGLQGPTQSPTFAVGYTAFHEAVPEPSSLALVVLAVVSLAGRRAAR